MSSAPAARDLANAIRALSMDAVQKAKSGHPGAPMGMADIAEVLWRGFLKHNPANPHWVDRDRFVLSNGHGSMLLYSLLHLTGYGVSLDDLKNFRQLGSPTAGHPEFGDAPGIETTTGPLGQGFANAVGMAIAEKMMAAQFNRDGHAIVDHNTYCFMGDGCMMEGISHEAASLAGTLGLGKLVAFYDDNGISIDGEVEGWFTDDTVERFRAYGWHVIPNVDGHSAQEVKLAIENARKNTDQPTLICCKTIIGFGSPNKQGKEESHGAALGDDEVALTREALGWKHGPFEIPDEIRNAWDAHDAGAEKEAAWQQRFDAYRAEFPELADEFLRRMRGELPADFDQRADAFIAECQQAKEKVASRKASQNTLDAFGPGLPELTGGSADLGGSNNTVWKGCKSISADDASGNYIHYGVREFGMTAAMNGICLHGGLRPYGGTFLTFMEYARNAVRMAALMHQPNILVYTHDSIGLGEDGPTHQPVEHLASLRAMPNLNVYRPADAVEAAECWKLALSTKTTPSIMALSRQKVPAVRLEAADENLSARGAYELRAAEGGEAQATLFATGSEVSIAVAARDLLQAEGVPTRVVSVPCWELFEAQDEAYKARIIGHSKIRAAVEAAVRLGWERFIGEDGVFVGMSGFGASAPYDRLYKEFGITAEALAAAVKAKL